MRPPHIVNRAILIHENRHHPWPQTRHLGPQPQYHFSHLLTQNFKDRFLLSLCPSSLCLPPPPLPSGPLIMEVVLHQFRIIFSLLVTLHHSLLIYLHRPRCTPPTPHHPIITPPPLQHNLDIPPSRLRFLSRTLQGHLVLIGLTRMHPSIIIPTYKLRATSVRALRPRTHGSTNLHRTQATTKWGLAILSLGLTLLDLNMRLTLGLALPLLLPQSQSQSHTPRSLVHSQCSSKTMM